MGGAAIVWRQPHEEDLLGSAARDEICRRVEAPHARRKPQWGKFNATQMLAHLNDAMRMAIGELPVPAKEAAPLRRWPLKQLVVYVLPWPQGAPTAPELLARATRGVRGEKAAFRGSRSPRVKRGPTGPSTPPRRALVSRLGRLEVPPCRPSPPPVRRVVITSTAVTAGSLSDIKRRTAAPVSSAVIRQREQVETATGAGRLGGD